MAGGAMDGGDDGLISSINVTPLVDVVLVLLIILMVTATAIASKTIPMDLPSAATGEDDAQSPTTLGISVDAEGALFLDLQPVDEDTLRERVRQARAEDEETRAIIAGDGDVPYGRIVRVIDLLRSLHVTKFAINVSLPTEAT